MQCATCYKNIFGKSILAAGEEFCSDVCHLRFLKDEMPNLGGCWISDEMIKELNKQSGQEREDHYKNINNFILEHMMDSPLFFKLRMNESDNDQ